MSKTPPITHYSQLEYKELDFHPFKRVRGVCYYDGFWTLLAQDVLKSWQKGLKWLHRHYRKEFVLGSIFLLALIPAPHRVKAMSPPQTQPLYIQSVGHLEPLQALSVPVPQLASPVLEPQPVAAPAPVSAPAASPGCTSGVTVSDYYENLLIQRESSGNSCANNGSCIGLLQACPSSKLYAACPTLAVACQLNYFEGYMSATYGSWANAWIKDEARSPHWW